MHHSDRGGQYNSLIFGQTARDAGIDISMGAKGCALDNAVAEAFFATLKKELTRRRSWPTRRELQSAVFAYIEAGTTAAGCTPRSAITRPPTTRTELSASPLLASPLRIITDHHQGEGCVGTSPNMICPELMELGF